jgi:putative hydrolase of the HAD superfamily
MKPRAIIFDLFGTLVHDFAAFTGEMNAEFAAALNAPFDLLMERWRGLSELRTLGAFQTVEASIEHVCGILSLQLTPERMARAVEVRLRFTRRALTPKDETLATLARVKESGYKIGLLSNCSIEIPIVWPETAMAARIDSSVFSSRERMRKPDTRIYRLACQRLDVAAEECLYIADGENFELAAAAKAGLYPVLVRNAAQDISRELHREAREWRGPAILDLNQVFQLFEDQAPEME